MAKNIPSDIIKKKRDIASRRERIEKNPLFSKRENGNKKRIKPVENNKKPRLAIWGLALVAVVFLFFSLSLLFSGASVNIIPKQQQIGLNGEFTADKTGLTPSSIPFSVMVVEAEEKETVTAKVSKNIQKKASGTIIIYNNYSSRNQRLIKNTRFETPDGKIYRIKKSVIVPGIITSDQEKTPGFVEVTVYADNPGKEYNIALTDFTIPGFKGDPRYSKFYARSKTKMTDGFSGILKTVSKEDISRIDKKLKESLEKKLLKDALSQKPDGFLLYSSGVFFEFEKIEQSLEKQSGDKIDFTKKGRLYGIIFNEKKLSQEIANSLIARFDNSQVKIMNIDTLSFEINKKEDFSPQKDDNFSFKLSGSPYIVWSFDENKLIKDLLGKNKKDFQRILSKYPNIESANVSIQPFWKRTFPKDIEDVKINKTINFNNLNF